MTDRPLVVAITGASGAVYALRLVDVLLQSGREVLLTISPSGRAVMLQELRIEIDLENFDAGSITTAATDTSQLQYFHYQDFMAPIASGSHLTDGMVICPCSGSTLSAIAHASGSNLIQRAADVHLKEGRRLIVVPRETPLSSLQLENMQRVCQAGAVVMPAAPGWYHGVESIQDLIDFIVARILDRLEVPHQLMGQWGEER